MDVSIIIPGIRPENWSWMLSSIKEACSKKYEVIFIGPVSEKESPVSGDNIKIIQDFANPNICQHKAILTSIGDIIHVFSDDCAYERNSIDKCLSVLSDAVVSNYDEGGNKAVHNFSLNHCYARTCTPDNFVLFNTAFMRRDLFFELGGFDCKFETLCVAQADLAARWQFSGYNVKILDIKLAQCGHMPDITGDHAPMHYAQLTHDIPYYIEKYKTIPTLKLDINNWKNYPSVWKRRFL